MKAILLPLAVAAALAAPASAQTAHCSTREHVIGHLADRFGEARQSIGLAAGNRIVEMFASPDTGTWTLTMTTPDGRTCIIGAGQAWERVEEDVTPAGQPT
jgi:hypothetical protein